MAYEYESDLYHFGTKGQKWGTRHWQNPDGTFNEAGKERYFGSKSISQRIKEAKVRKKRKAALEKARQAKVAKKKQQEEELKKNPLSKYTTEQIREMNSRMDAELAYKEKYAKLHPVQASFGKKFVDSTLDKLAKDTLPTIVNTTIKTEGIKFVNNLLKTLNEDSGGQEKKSDKQKKSEKDQKSNSEQKTSNDSNKKEVDTELEELIRRNLSISISNMSNQDLDNAIKRIDKELQYKEKYKKFNEMN